MEEDTIDERDDNYDYPDYSTDEETDEDERSINVIRINAHIIRKRRLNELRDEEI